MRPVCRASARPFTAIVAATRPSADRLPRTVEPSAGAAMLTAAVDGLGAASGTVVGAWRSGLWPPHAVTARAASAQVVASRRLGAAVTGVSGSWASSHQAVAAHPPDDEARGDRRPRKGEVDAVCLTHGHGAALPPHALAELAAGREGHSEIDGVHDSWKGPRGGAQGAVD